MVLKGLKDGFLMSSSAGDGAQGGGSGGPAPNAAFIASLPEAIRSNEAFKDVGDVGTLATRYVAAKTFSIPEKYTKDNPALKDFKSLDGLLESYNNVNKLVG